MTRTILRYALLVLLVAALGTLAGWYVFLRSQTKATQSLDSARGFTEGAVSPFSTGAGGSDYTVASSAPATTQKPPQLWHIATAPAAGIGFATTTTGVRARYAERATGYIFDADPASSQTARLTNTLTPKTYEASFAGGDRVLERGLDASGDVTTFAGYILNGTTTSVSGVDLPRGIESVAANPVAQQVVYLAAQAGTEEVISANWDGSKPKNLFGLTVPGWRLSLLSDGRIILAQKAVDGLLGYAYVLKGGALTEVAPALPGLTVLPRSNSDAMLYGLSSGAGPELFVQLSATTSAVQLPIHTVADKCVWAPGPSPVAYCAVPQHVPTGGFLDAWYRGELHTSDIWWKVDARTGQAQQIFSPPSNVSLDVVDPVMDDTGLYVAFLNNTDRSPWLLRLEQ